MPPGIFCVLSIGLAIAPALDAQGAGRVRPSVITAEHTWLHLETKRVPDDFVPNLYKERWVDYFAPPNIAENPSEIERIKASNDFRFSEDKAEISEPGSSGFPVGAYWKFENPDGGRWPTRALLITFPSQDSYTVNAVAHCGLSDSRCEEWAASLAHMPAPEPDYDYRVGLTGSYRQWEDLVMTEPCTPGPVRMSPPEYPRATAKAGIEGNVAVIILTNPCGEVRTVGIEQSSRNRDLDRAAMEAVREWRIDVPFPEKSLGKGTKGRINVPFMLK